MFGLRTRPRAKPSRPGKLPGWKCAALIPIGLLVGLAGLNQAGADPAGVGQASSSQGAETRRSEIVAPGIEYIQIRRGDFTAPEGADRWTIHVLLLDPSRAQIRPAIAMDEIAGAETTSSIAARHGAAAAVNGGYFRTTGTFRGEPAGLLALGGRFLSEPNPNRAVLALTNAGGRTRLAVAQVDFKAEIVVKGLSPRAVDGINRPRGEDELILFTPEFHRTTLTAPDGLEAVVRRGRIREIADGRGSSPIPEDGFILSAAGKARMWARQSLRPGLKISVGTDLKATPPFPFAPEFLLGGGPHLRSNGKPIPGEAENFPAGFYTTRHPRTAAGIRSDGTIVLAVVDGRQPKVGVGMTIPELADLMGELGCAEAINLDGGGSTTMVVGGRLVNSPSDSAGERPVSDALLVFPRSAYFFQTGKLRPGVQGAPAASNAWPSFFRSTSIRPRSFSRTSPNPAAAIS